MDCSICCDTFNQSNRKAVTCPKCNEKCCVSCVKKFIHGSLEDPHCMHCKHQWDLFFVNTILPRAYMVSQWKTSRSSLLLNREKSYFPETMPLVAAQIQKEKIQKQIKEIEEQEKKLKAQKRELNWVLYDLNHPGAAAAAPTPATEATSSKQNFDIRQCPTANCKGFLDTKSGSCAICQKYTCLKCNSAKVEGLEHECKQDDLDTWAMIKSDSKPCPNCGTRIQKTEGCAQMWCPGCHVAFNWNTGAIEKGAVHNPHYYEWAARLGEAAVAPQYQQNPCNAQNVWHYYHYPTDIRQTVGFQTLHQRLNHLIHNDLVRLREKLVHNNTDLRIMFLRNFIDEEYYKKSLVARELQHQKDQRMVECMETLNLVATPLFHALQTRQISFTEVKTQIGQLEKFVNDSITQLNDAFRSKIGPIKIFV